MGYKEFQKKAIAKIVEGYETNKNNNRFLVADEVGLGKTFIAKGVISCLMYYHYLEEKKCDSNKKTFEYKVLYLCSNLNIAEQNKRKLGLSTGEKSDFYKDYLAGNEEFSSYGKNIDEAGSSVENRTTMLLRQQIKKNEQFTKATDLRGECVKILGEDIVIEKEKKCDYIWDNDNPQNADDKISLNIIPITPNTSIKIKNGGHIEERRFISYVLNRISDNEGKRINDNNDIDQNNDKLLSLIKNLMSKKDKNGKDGEWVYFNLSDDEKSEIDVYLKSDNHSKGFLDALRNLLDREELKISELNGSKYKGLARKISMPFDDYEDWKEGWEKVRKWFALASMELLKYDFVVMDEFQNFNDILQKANQTELSKNKYLDQVNYIYSILKTVKSDSRLIQNIENIFGEIDEIKLSDYERKFWSGKLENFTFDDSKKFDEIINDFFELSKPDEGSSNEDKENLAKLNEDSPNEDKESLAKLNEDSSNEDKGNLSGPDEYQLVKAILEYKLIDNNEKLRGDYREIIWKEYNLINPSNVFRNLKTIEYGDKEKTTKKSTEEVFKNINLDYKVLKNMYVEGDYESFSTEYKNIRASLPFKSNESYSKTPFDYLVYLFLESKDSAQQLPVNCDTATNPNTQKASEGPSPQLLINCFQYFNKKNNREKSIKIWQYAHIMQELMGDNGRVCDYSVEELEPYRKMLGLYDASERVDRDYSNADEQMLLSHIFKNEVNSSNYTRILMLSATPFKMYDNNDENEQKNANIMEVCDFLDQYSRQNVSEQLIKYKNALLNYSYSEVQQGEVINEKAAFQKKMSSIFTRMERYAVLRSMNDEWFNNMLNSDSGLGELPCGQIAELKEYLEEIKNMEVGSSYLNFAIDSPYMGTFMHSNSKDSGSSEDDADGYKWKKLWKQQINECSIEYNSSSKLYISRDIFDKNEEALGLWHGVFNETLQRLLDLPKDLPKDLTSDLSRNLSNDKESQELDNHPGAARLLWIPSCINKDKLSGPFMEHRDYGKTIIFSRYIQTPRMLACLTSYESKRRLCCHIEKIWVDNEKDFRSYNSARQLSETDAKNVVNNEKDFRGYIAALIDVLEIKHEDRSIYQCLTAIADFIKKDLLKRLAPEQNEQSENDYLKKTFKAAIEKYFLMLGYQTDSLDKVNELIFEVTRAFANKVLLNEEQGLLSIWASFGFPNIDIEEAINQKENDFIDQKENYSIDQEAEETINQRVKDSIDQKVEEAIDQKEKDSINQKAKNSVNKKIKEQLVEECYKLIVKYCEAGRLCDVLDEWLYICYESNRDFGEYLGLKKGEFLSFIKESRISIDLYAADSKGNIQDNSKDSSQKKNIENKDNDSNGNIQESKKDGKVTNNAVLYFARCIGMSKDDDNINAVAGLQQSFNAPFAPFVFATTSMGQEGLDFHYYADNIVHWKLPSNPVDFEQREGRINRYHCLAIRKKIIEWWYKPDSNKEELNKEDLNKYDPDMNAYEIFEKAFSAARSGLEGKDLSLDSIEKCEILPDWILLDENKTHTASIKRLVPYFYLSKMAKDYNQNLKVLQLYRTVIGQGNPEEIMSRLMSSKTEEEVKELFVDFSPYCKN